MKIQASNNGGYLDKMSVDIRKAIRQYLHKIGATPQFSTVLENDEVLRIRVDSIDRSNDLADYVYDTMSDPMLSVDVVDGNVLEIRNSIDRNTSVEGANNYGGAYDIDSEVFFTRDDLNDLAEEVMGHVEETFSGEFKLTDIYVDGSNNQDIFIEVDWFDTGISYMANIHIDMRSIRRPSDLTKKYALPLAANLIEQMREDAPTVVESATDSINAASPDDYLNPPEYDEPCILDEEQETIEVDIDAIIIIDEEGSWEYEDEEYPWARPADGDTDWYSEIYPSLVLSDHINIVEIVDIKISDKLPDEPGRYHITGHFSMTFEISNVEEVSTYIGRDEDDSPAFDIEYYTDDAEVDRISKKDKLVDFKCVKLGDAIQSSTAIQASITIDEPKEVNSGRYNLYSNAQYGNTRFSVYYNLIDNSDEADPIQMLEQFRAQISENHPYDEAPYVSAHLQRGIIKFMQNGKVVGQSSYSDADSMDLENWEWCDAVISDAITELREYNSSVQPRMSHN